MMKIPKFSLGSWAFSFGPFESAPWDFDRFIDYAANAGYDGVEINGFRPHPHPDDFATRDACSELASQLSDRGLGISGYAPDFREVAPTEVDAAAYLAVLEKVLTFSERMGISTVRVDTVSPPVLHKEDEYKRRFDRLANTWQQAATRAAESGITIVWEFEPGFWLNRPSEVKAIVDAVDHPSFKLLFDTSHAYMGAVIGARQTGVTEILKGGTAEYAQLVREQIGHVHLIDCDGTLHEEETSTHSPFGEGNVDFKKVLSALAPVWDNFEWVCFDFCFCPTTEADAVKAIPYVRNLLQECA
jgi:sugar phosphate isomerase/epimerase